jgi:uncharacterized protein (DUF2249 family)
MMTKQLIDVRPILAEGGCPFDTVLEAGKTLQDGEGLTLLAPFNPIPIYQALSGIGVDFVEVNRDEDGDFTVDFRRTPLRERPLHLDLDLTDLDPPRPMMRVAEALAEAKGGQTLRFRTRFKPVHMLQSLDPACTCYVSDEQADGTWFTRILKCEVVRCEH